ncbi:hypothetical protein MHBO_000821 [Bonamia ostreae]|uniref:Calcium-regulated actin-bundling protein C-terminal domain-containing protein n=1 Tax=Bonamia ostreae TaxID=126728 RepID=A0ABV2AGX6_9EUKA
MAELDEDKGDKGNSLGEFDAHRFLEQIKETKTIIELRQTSKNKFEIDRKQNMTLTEYLIFKYFKNKQNWKDYVETLQGDENEILKAKNLLNDAQMKLSKCKQLLSEAKKTEQTQREKSRISIEAHKKSVEKAEMAENAKTDALLKEKNANEATEEAEKAKIVAIEAEKQAKIALEQSKEAHNISMLSSKEAELADAQMEIAVKNAQVAEEDVRKLQIQSKKALDQLKHEELIQENKIKILIEKTKKGSNVQRNLAKHELAQTKQEDPLPLRTAKIKQEAAMRKSQRAHRIEQEKLASVYSAKEKAKQNKEKAINDEKISKKKLNESEDASMNSIKEKNAMNELYKKSLAESKEAQLAAMNAKNIFEQSQNAKEIAKIARDESELASRDASQAALKADKSLEEAKLAYNEAENYVKNSTKGMAKGSKWWIERKITEEKMHLPQSKGGMSKKNAYWLV